MTDLLQTALEAARAAAAVHRDHLGRVDAQAWAEKGTADFVTHVDREAEARIVEVIRTRFPGHQFLVEEGSAGLAADAGIAALEGSDWTWIADPLDGTTNFLHGYPMFAASVAVARRGIVVAGAVIDSARGEEWTALRGEGAWRNGERIHVSAIDRLPRALIGTGFPFKAQHLLPEYLRQFDHVLRATSGIRRTGAAALDLCHLATGWFDGFWELDLLPWDVAAGSLVVEEAGGVITNVSGAPGVLRHGSILAGNPPIWRQLKALLDYL